MALWRKGHVFDVIQELAEPTDQAHLASKLLEKQRHIIMTRDEE